MRRLNFRLLNLFLGFCLFFGIGIFFLHGFQSARIAEAILWQAKKYEEENNFDQSWPAICITG
jgi:hypothetical protein